jgi:dihydrofolate synthase/folylpolyglutamate synthase
VPRRFSSLDDWLAWLETLHPKKIDFSLNRICAVLDALGLRTPPYRVITVGGTNGKGSCVAFLESIYRQAGYSVGAFTSPHLWRFNERLRLNGADIDDATLMDLFERMDKARGNVTLSYFEASAVAAMLYFARAGVDVAILEVGMGGRLDAVNVYDADAALIVSIDLDHEDWLGKDRDAIGREKAGILRRGRPAVIADLDPPASVLAAIEATGADARLIGRDFGVEAGGQGLVYRAAGAAPETFSKPSFGTGVQLQNAAACVAVVDSLQSSLPVDRAAVSAGLAGARVAGRMECIVLDDVEWIFDVAHNPAAAARLQHVLEDLEPATNTYAVFGAMLDKDLAGVLALFRATVDRWFIAVLDSERSATTEVLAAVLALQGARFVETAPDIAAAAHAARDLARPGDRVIVFGSFYTVGPAMAALGLYSPALSKG